MRACKREMIGGGAIDRWLILANYSVDNITSVVLSCVSGLLFPYHGERRLYIYNGSK